MQSAIASSMTAGRQGALACAPDEALIVPATAADAIRCGLLAQLAAPTDSPGSMKASLVAALAVDVDSVIATIASAGTAQTIVAASFDGVGVGGAGALMSPARRLGLALSSHANWDATVAYITGEDASGRVIKEALLIPDAGNVTVTTKNYFSRVTELYIPVQGGASGTATLGVTADDAQFSRRESGIVVYNPHHEPYTADEAFTAADPVGILQRGRIWVPVEAAVAVNAQAYVRCATASTNIRGQWTGAPTANFAALPNAVFRTSTSGAGLAVLELL
jgi:hypothetical protein